MDIWNFPHYSTTVKGEIIPDKTIQILLPFKPSLFFSQWWVSSNCEVYLQNMNTEASTSNIPEWVWLLNNTIQAWLEPVTIR